MQRERLTNQRISKFSLPPGKSQEFIFDTEAPRLAVRVTAGAKAFIFEGKLNRQTIRRTIGSTAAWNLEDARAEARRLQTMLDTGIDPRELDREQAAAKAAAKAEAEAAEKECERRKKFTLEAMCHAYADHLAAQGKVKTARDVRSAFRVHVIKASPDVAATAAVEVTSIQIAGIIRKARETGKERTAGILRNYLVAAYNAARRAPFDSGVASNLIEFGITANPAENIPAIPVKAGDRTLTADELKAYLAALGTDAPATTLRVALLAGGQRMAQLVRATVADFNLDTATLRLWDGKGKRSSAREHLLPLAPKAAALVATLAGSRSDPGDLLFGATERAAGDRVSEISAKMGGPPFDLRDIRRTCETMLAALRINKDTRAHLLSHGIGGVQDAHYDRHTYADEKRAALVAWESRLTEIETGVAPASNVIKLAGAAA
jgi:integrase